MSTTIKGLSEEPKRHKLRFPIQKDVCYRCLRSGDLSAIGVGRTLQISSREVRFTTQHALQLGETVRVAMDWPAMLDNTCLMKLEICGSVVRSELDRAAVKIEKYEFRTRGATLGVMHSGAG